MTTQNNLIGYAASFASFLLDSTTGQKINKIILFGSVARGDFTAKSDIDLFIDAPERLEPEVENILGLFRSSQLYRTWKLKGISNELSLKVGSLAAWSLRREVISSGILLYGKYSELPEKAKYYMLICLDLPRMAIARQMRFWRTLYGYKQKVGKKVYITKGLIEKAQGKKLGKGILLVPMESRKEILDFLKKNKIKYSLHELWSDTF